MAIPVLDLVGNRVSCAIGIWEAVAFGSARLRGQSAPPRIIAIRNNLLSRRIWVGKARWNAMRRVGDRRGIAEEGSEIEFWNSSGVYWSKKIEIRTNETVGEWKIGDGSQWPRLAAHDLAWSRALRDGLHHKSFDLTAHDTEGGVIGYLPLTFVKSWLFGKFLVSQPYLNTGGVWADDEAVSRSLVDRAVALADELDVKHLELRHEKPLEHGKLSRSRTDKVHMRLTLPESSEALMKSFKSKLRSQVKKTFEHPFELQWGQDDVLQEFYAVFARNMRDLGTPVYSQQLFRSILRAFPRSSELCVVRLQGSVVAGALLLHERGRTEVPSASCLREFNSTGANMWMYWQLLQRAIERGSQEFDFGRSSIDSGTYKFKEQWGAIPHPAHWQYFVRSGAPEDMRPTSPKRQRLIHAWQKMPVWLTRCIGPSIVRGIP